MPRVKLCSGYVRDSRSKMGCLAVLQVCTSERTTVCLDDTIGLQHFSETARIANVRLLQNMKLFKFLWKLLDCFDDTAEAMIR